MGILRFSQGDLRPWPVEGGQAYEDLRLSVVKHADWLGFTAFPNKGQEGCGYGMSWLYLHPTPTSAKLWLQLSLSEAGVSNLGGTVDVKSVTRMRDLSHVRAVAVQLMACVAAAYRPCGQGWGSFLRASDGTTKVGHKNTATKMNIDPGRTIYNELESVCYTSSLWFVRPNTVRAFSELSMGGKERPPATTFFGSIRGGILRNGGTGWGTRKLNKNLLVASWKTCKPARRCVIRASFHRMSIVYIGSSPVSLLPTVPNAFCTRFSPPTSCH